MSEEKKESWGAVVGGCFLWFLIISALTYGAIMAVLWLKGVRDNANKETQKALTIQQTIKESMLPVGKADTFSIDSPFFNNTVVVYRAKIGDVYYVIVQGKNGSVAICPEPTEKKSTDRRGVNEIF